MAQKKHISICAVILLILLVSLFTFNTYSSEAKISEALRKEISSGSEQVEVLIYMAAQTDTEKIALEIKRESPKSTEARQIKKETRTAIINKLQDTAQTNQAPLLSYLEKKEIEGQASEIESYFIVNIIYARVSPHLVQEIARRSDVHHIYLNDAVKLDEPNLKDTFYVQEGKDVSWNVEHVGAPEVWAKYDVDGSGVVIGIIDTGVNWEHPALQDNWRGFDQDKPDPNYNWYDPIYNRSMPDDKHGHGTGVIGIAVGRDEVNHKYIGIAPGSTWIAARGLDDSGSGNNRILIKTGQFILAPTDTEGNKANPELAPDIVINSWGSQLGQDDWYREMVQNWRNALIFPVFAVGNAGPGDYTIYNPANYPESFSVGAIDANNELPSFSSRGPGSYGDMIKPELVAPGVGTYTSTVDDYGFASGTSLAAPHIAGAAAMLMSIDSTLDIGEVEKILKETATPLTDSNYPISPNYGFGYGLVSPLKAVESVLSVHYTLSVTIQGQGTTEPAPGIYVYPEGQQVTFTAEAHVGHKFEKWVVDNAESTEDILTITMDKDKEATAFFVETEELDGWVIIDGPDEPVALDEAWLITFNRPFLLEEIDGIVIERDNSFIPVDIQLIAEEGQIIVTPVDSYLPGETYNLRIFLENLKRYKMHFSTKEGG